MGNYKLNQNQAQEIINRYVEGEQSKDLAKIYNMSKRAICRILSGEAWKQCVLPNNMKEIIKSNHYKPQCLDLPELTEIQKDIIIGSLLGDGCVPKCKKTVILVNIKNILERNI